MGILKKVGKIAKPTSVVGSMILGAAGFIVYSIIIRKFPKADVTRYIPI